MTAPAYLRRSPQRYGFALVTVLVALGIGLFVERLHWRVAPTALFLLAIAITAWYTGARAATFATVLSTLIVDYSFMDPRNSLGVESTDIAYLVMFVILAAVITRFSSVRHRIEDDLIRSRDALAKEVAERMRREEEIRGLNTELEKQTVALEASNKELEAFAYSVSHDLRAPLRHIAGFTELLQRHLAPNIDDKGQRYLTMILDSGKRMGNLIDDLLAFSRIGRAETHNTTFSLQQVVQEAITDVQPETTGRTIDWSVGSLPTVYGDRAMIRLVFSNLISNAIKFTRTRERAEIEIQCADDTNGRLVVSVRDNGVGFDMRYVNKLFGVFQRLHTHDTFEGTGIGLATVQRIVHRHGGSTWAEGALDNGATFYVSLPKPGMVST